VRITDAMVRDFLVWARNYGEIEHFERLEGGGRCWKITLPGICRAHGGDGPLLGEWGDEPHRVVPREFVLTSREAFAFGYGVAVGGAAERRSEFAAREWKWGVEEPEEEPERAPGELAKGGG